ncbi:MAG: hypothetical protein KC413_17500 [Anaerolineales bacterium]|nr:hypothetical protein [Anaerolineales bacterium]
MMRKRLLFAFVAALMVCIVLGTELTRAQMQDNRWRLPQLISTPGVEQTGEAVLVPDQYGFVHMFWQEMGPDDERESIMYTRYDGRTWADPIDIRVAPPGLTIGTISPTIDSEGLLHLIWNEGNSGPVYYMSAPAYDALSVQHWSTPQYIDLPAYLPQLRIDDAGVFHIVYSNFYGQEPGIYYTRSFDRGITWSNPVWLDPDIATNQAPQLMHFELDAEGGLHVLWLYIGLDTGAALGQWIRYAHSLDGGDTWSRPFTIDEADDTPDELRVSHPGFAVVGNTVHAIWAGNTDVEREHRYSLDRGVTWTETEHLFGHLQGMALGDALTGDENGRLHLLAQIRWPQGIYYTTWDAESGWKPITMIYLIAANGLEERDGRYHAHSLRSTIRGGNELVAAFTNEAFGPMYVTSRILDDLDPITPLPFPSPTPQPTPRTTVTPVEMTPTPRPFQPGTSGSTDVPNLGSSIWEGALPAVLFVFGAVIFWIVKNRQRFL